MSDQPIEKPEKPAPNECCGGGSCCPCVWDDYFDRLRLWKQQQGIESEPKKPQPREPDEDTFYR
ncbi:MAG: hypothetical protein OQK12_00925 [Motiliproteus sp.]|nr:hypothetical protein [Motiliproteus sp.]MCW9053724.1 hypothetical protein [Motiliproteus sp.]